MHDKLLTLADNYCVLAQPRRRVDDDVIAELPSWLRTTGWLMRDSLASPWSASQRRCDHAALLSHAHVVLRDVHDAICFVALILVRAVDNHRHELIVLSAECGRTGLN